ncbi:condensation domain-containing protein, partial [Rhizobium sp. Root1203]|uniref:condensation domain-containing protein n=1 Tax=Rhizobium sp. Root1203 TaxID=1736427 RepID=UPI000B011CD9
QSSRQPRTPQEEIIAGLFVELLGVDKVGIDDNFFELGGDSIMSIQLVSRARKAGLKISPRDVFQRQTVRQLSELAAPVGKVETIGRDAEAIGTVPPTPIIARMKELGGPFKQHNQAIVVQTPAGLQERHLLAGLKQLLTHHDALRLRVNAMRGDIELEITPEAQSIDPSRLLTAVRITNDNAGVSPELLASWKKIAVAKLDPASGIMLQAVWFDAGDHRPGRLMLVLNHLVADGVSWRILLPDLQAAVTGAQKDRPLKLDAVATSFRSWSHHLATEAMASARVQELPLWLDQSRDEGALVSKRALHPAVDTPETAQTFTLTLSPSVAEPLLTQLPRKFQAEVNDLLLTAFSLAVVDWRRRSGQNVSAAFLELEGHGRESIGDGLDLSRTIGWFTTQFPVRFDLAFLNIEDALSGGVALRYAVEIVSQQLRRLPDHGLGYGLLRYLNPETALALRSRPSPQILFNYLGRFSVPDGLDWSVASEVALIGDGNDSSMPIAYPIEINAIALERPHGLELEARWTWATQILTERQVRDLAATWFQALNALLVCSQRDHFAQPSNISSLVNLTQADIDRLEASFDPAH